MKNKTHRSWLAVAFVALLAACGSSTTPETLTLGDASVTVQAGASQSASVSLTSAGIEGTAQLSYEGVPAGVSFAPRSVALSGNEQTLKLVCSADPSAAPGSYRVTLTATVGSTRAHAAITLKVTAAPSDIGTLVVSVQGAVGANFAPSVKVLDASSSVVGTVSAFGDSSFDLAPGTYRVTAEPVSADGYTYAGTVTGSPVAVTAGQTASASAAYAATTGTLAITVSVEDGITPSVEVRDTGGAVVQTISAAGTTTLTDLAPGTYSLVATNVSASGYTYAATLTGSPATVTAGQTATASAAYAATTGTLAITVSVVDGITPSVEVRDAGGAVVQTISAAGTTTLTDLAPGTYSLVAANVSANGYTYAATLTGSPATVAAGQTATASADYAATTGTLAVTVSVVDGITPSVEVRDADGAVVRTLDTAGTTVITGLAPGTYSLVAANVSASGYTYAATLTGSPATVTAGQTATAGATYAATTGALAVTVSVVDGITPSVEVRDTGGAVVQTISAAGTTTLTDLAPGDYTVDPSLVMDGANLYAAEGSTVTIPAGQQAAAAVSYLLTTPPSAVDDESTGQQGGAVSLNLLANDSAGVPAATVVSFGGGSLGGDVTSNTAGAGASLGGGTLSIDAAGNLSLGADAAVGVYTFQYRLENVGGTSDATVTLSLCTNLAVGQTFVSTVADMPALCLGTADVAQEFAIVATNHSTQSLTLSALATDIQGTVGPPNPIAPLAPIEQSALELPLAPPASGSEHLDPEPLVAQEDALPSLVAARARGGLLRPSTSQQIIQPGVVPSVGDPMSLAVPTNALCSGTPVVHTGTVQAVSAHAIFVTDDQNPAGGFSASEYSALASEFETAYAVVDSKFGAIPDLDQNQHVVVFITSAVNQLPVGTDAFSDDGLHPVALFLTRDVFSSDPIDGCSQSNEGEILYLEAPDPAGVLGRVVTTNSLITFSTAFAPPALAFELTALNDAFRRAYVTDASFFEEPWLTRAIGTMALEQVFFAESVGLQENQNLIVTNLTTGANASARVAAFNRYVNRDYARLSVWLQHPQQVGLLNPVGSGSSDSLSQQGLGWAFLRYAKDRHLGADQGTASDTFLSDLVNSNRQGLDNVQNAIGGASVDDWLRDFAVAMYGDDNALPLDPAYQITTWNFRSLYGALGGFSLQVAALASDTSDTRTLTAQGSTQYWRAGVAASTFAPLTFSVQPGFDASKASYVILRTK